MGKIVIITGGTSSIGLETARLLTSRGCKVYELSRRENGTDVAVHIQADVTDEKQVILILSSTTQDLEYPERSSIRTQRKRSDSLT